MLQERTFVLSTLPLVSGCFGFEGKAAILSLTFRPNCIRYSRTQISHLFTFNHVMSFNPYAPSFDPRTFPDLNGLATATTYSHYTPTRPNTVRTPANSARSPGNFFTRTYNTVMGKSPAAGGPNGTTLSNNSGVSAKPKKAPMSSAEKHRAAQAAIARLRERKGLPPRRA